MRDSSLLFQALELYELPFSGGSPAEQAIHCRSTRLQMTDCVQQACCVSTAKHANLISFSGSALPRSMLLSMYTTHTKKSTTSGVSVDSWNFRKQRISVCTFYIYVTEGMITVNHILPKPYFLFFISTNKNVSYSNCTRLSTLHLSKFVFYFHVLFSPMRASQVSLLLQ